MKFSEIIDGLKNGQAYTRFKTEAWYGKFICMQLPQTVPAHVVPKMNSLPEHVKARIGTVGLEDEFKGTITYHDQVIIVTSNDYARTSATSYVPTWEDIFADDWATA